MGFWNCGHFAFCLHGNGLINSQLAPVFKVHPCPLLAVGNICFMNKHTQQCSNTCTHKHTQRLCQGGETSAVCCSQIIDSSKQKVEGKTGISHADEIFTTCQPIQTNALLPTRMARQQQALPYHAFPISGREGSDRNKDFTEKRPWDMRNVFLIHNIVVYS